MPLDRSVYPSYLEFVLKNSPADVFRQIEYLNTNRDIFLVKRSESCYFMLSKI
jgi:hypothetical protein